MPKVLEITPIIPQTETITKRAKIPQIIIFLDFSLPSSSLDPKIYCPRPQKKYRTAKVINIGISRSIIFFMVLNTDPTVAAKANVGKDIANKYVIFFIK